MATHSSVLAWRIPGMGEPGGLPSTGSLRVGHHCRVRHIVRHIVGQHGVRHHCSRYIRTAIRGTAVQ